MSDIIDLEAWRAAAAESLTQLVSRAAQLLPALASAVVILILGWGVSRLATALTVRVLTRLGFDRTCERLRVTETLRRARISLTPSMIAARVIGWVLLLAFAFSAAETLGLRSVTRIIDYTIAYVPRLGSAVLVVALGLPLGRLARNLVQSAGTMAGLAQASPLGTVVQAAIILITGVLALAQLGIQTDILVTVITALITTLGLTLGAAFALGARPLVTHILAGHSLRAHLDVGTAVEVVGRKGVVERIGAFDTYFRDEGRRWSMPNAVLLEEIRAY